MSSGLSSILPVAGGAVPDGAAIRALRGSESRAAFARRLGVTAHTVYRWELPDAAVEARRPRGVVLERLQAMASGAAQPAREHALAQDPAALATALAGFARLLQGEWRAAEPVLLQALMAGPDVSEDAAALGGAGLALAEVVLRSDARAALSTLGSALAAAGRDRLSPQVAAMVYAVAAAAHGLCDARFFDLGRVHSYQARVEALAPRGGGDDARLLACIAAGWSCVVAGDHHLLLRAFEVLDPLAITSPPPALALLAEEAIAFRTLILGRIAESERLLALLAARAEALGASLVQARALASLAGRYLDDLSAPHQALELARRAQDLARQARAALGLHTIFAGRAEAEALFRLGRVDEARASLLVLDDYWRETGIPPTAAVGTAARILFLKNDLDGLKALAARYRACAVPAVDQLAQATASCLDALASLAPTADGVTALAVFDRAEREAARWPFLLRDIAINRPLVFVMDPDLPGHEAALRHAQRAFDSFPSAWASARLRRAEGTILASRGQVLEGRRLLQAALATFEAAACAPDVAMVKHELAALAMDEGAPDAAAQVAESEAALRAMGMSFPEAFRRALARAHARPGAPESGASGATLETLAVALQRLLVQGAAPALVQRELLSVAETLLPGRIPRLEEVDSNRRSHPLGGLPLSEADATWVELGDGTGRRLRLGVAGPVSPAEKASLAMIALTAGAALQIAALRGLSTARPDPLTDDAAAAGLPGFIAVSPAMRHLRADLARFAGSRATVIITGQSGVGKEVVARAIHDLSSRAGRPYVTFNCAATPRELFEAQLFGHRKGAFTGATSDQPGTIRAADGGTLFLDKIGELPLDVQPKLLRFLENGEVSPLGERRPVTVDVRIVAATHRDLEALVRQGRFREDLYFRLQVIPLRVPPLRERREDIPALARHFLRDLGPKGRAPVLAPDALALMTAHDWPGNVRELRNVIERTLAFAPEAAVLSAADLRMG